MEYRIEKDTMGEVKVPAEKYWGAQTERSRNNFKIGQSASMPLEVVYGFAYLKKAAAYCLDRQKLFSLITLKNITKSEVVINKEEKY